MNSGRYAILQALKGVLQDYIDGLTDGAVTLLINPALPIGLAGKEPRVLFVLHRGDQLIDQPAQKEKRKARIVVGALARTASADQDADTLHFGAVLAIRNARTSLMQACPIGPIREVQVEAEIKETKVEGELLMSAFEIEYFQTYPQ
jgi:hypothetical protein